MPPHRLSGPLLLCFVAALLLPACGEDNPAGLPDVARAVVRLTVNPNPIEGVQSPLTGSVSASYRVTVSELAGLGGEVVFLSATVFDPATGLQVTVNYFDGADLVVFVGTKRLEPGGTLEVPQTLNYALPDLRVEAQVVIAVQLRDDRGNLINRSILVQVV